MNIIKCSLSFLLLMIAYSPSLGQSVPKNYGRIQTKLFLGDNKSQALMVAFGGSEGGNTFASEQSNDLRAKFLDRGFSFLSIGYFGDKGLPKQLDRISLNAIYDTIKNVCRRINLDSSKIVLIGASRGAELALNLASRYNVMGVIALVPPSVSIPYVDNDKNNSSWMFDNKEVPYLRLQYDLIKMDGLHKTIEANLDKENEEGESFIKLENIKGFIILSSGKTDELWPSLQMCNGMIERLKKYDFKNYYEHISIDGGHQPSKHWDIIFTYIDEHIL